MGDDRRAALAAQVIVEGFAEYHEAFRAQGRAAADDFRARDWRTGRERATARLTLYSQYVQSTLVTLDGILKADSGSRDAWMSLRAPFAAAIAGRPDREIAETFFNSLTRRRLETVGVDRGVEFTFPERRSAPRSTRQAPLVVRECTDDCAPALHDLLAHVAPPLAEPAREIRLAAGALLEQVQPELGAIHAIELLGTVFYRSKTACVVGAVTGAAGRRPLLLVLLNGPDGPSIDAVLTTADELSVVFGFSWSYFLADLESPAAVVAYLRGIMPLKRADELYTSLGYNRHGKTELYRSLLRQLEQEEVQFAEAEGARGLVMRVITLPTLNVVFKLIRDDISPIKHTNRREVMKSYQFVFERDRVGRLADAQEFERLVFPRHCMPPLLLSELQRTSPSSVFAEEDRVVIQHCYTQRRVRPLNLFLQEASAAEAEAAVLDYGQAIKDLAAADIFPGDMLTKNCGVSRHGRVIFYDFDELTTLDSCVFRELPAPLSTDDELASEPWFSMGEHDVFPEQFAPFLIPAGPLADLLREQHGELFEPAWWRWVQEQVAAGEIVDTFPYPASRRLRRDGRA